MLSYDKWMVQQSDISAHEWIRTKDKNLMDSSIKVSAISYLTKAITFEWQNEQTDYSENWKFHENGGGRGVRYQIYSLSQVIS